MSPKRFEAHCLRLPAATKVVQWEGTSVFKVGGKMFALARGFVERFGGGFRAKWVQLVDNDALPESELAAYLDRAHALVVAKLARRARKKLRLG